MGRVSGRHVRPLVHLGSLIFFFVFLRTKFSGEVSSSGVECGEILDRGDLSLSEGSKWGGVYRETSRHLLGRMEGFRSREWKYAAGKSAGVVEEGALTLNSPDSRRSAAEDSHQHSMPVVLQNLTNPNLQNETIVDGDSRLKEAFTACENINSHIGYQDSCSYVRANPLCQSGTMIEYVEFYYCTCAKAPAVAYFAFLVWLAALFYMLGNTAADFFCSSLEKLSKLLHLSPTVAGVSLLPLGNGAPDVFASIAAFMGTSRGQVGLNSVLGGAMFVTSIVAGSVGLVVSSLHGVGLLQLDRNSFLRDVAFFMVTLVSLCLIIIVGKINLWGATAYISLYAVYGCLVATGECVKKQVLKSRKSSYALEPLLLSSSPTDEEGSGYVSEETIVENNLPQWMWTSNVAIYSHKGLATLEASSRPLWGWSEQEEAEIQAQRLPSRIFLQIILTVLTLPRRLTIPVVEDLQWSRPFAIASAFLAPTLLATVWDRNDNQPFGSSSTVYILGGTVGVLLGVLAFFTTRSEHPPRRFLFPWAFGGFVMSIVWFYLIANELVAALVALGVILEIDAAILGLTVLAWGNSIGDLMSNTALAFKSNDGAQIAITGCYAGPMFNTLVGLGLSFLLASWKTYPSAFEIPTDYSLFYTLGFLYAGLLWSIVGLPALSMRPSKGFSIGLLLLYGAFLSLRLASFTGLVSLPGLSTESGLDSVIAA